MNKGGYFVISLDFELMWGMFDKVTTKSYGDNILGVPTAISEILATFENHNIHATWATVGMLMARNAIELESFLPLQNERPLYKNQSLSSYQYFENFVRLNESHTHYHFAPELVKKIMTTQGQELASHTFSHYYCLDGGENGEVIFTADCVAQKKIMNAFNVSPASIIFPRNQTTQEALEVCQKAGITSYRGTESHFLYRARSETDQTNLFIRALRLLDHYLNLSGYQTYPLPQKDGSLVNLPASRFLRPYSHKLSLLESLRMRRIKTAMTHAAKHDQIFHLWWHPHNFGINRKENVRNLLELLNHYQTLRQTYGMQSKNMSELTTLVLE